MSNKLFTSVPVPKFPRSTFNLSRPVLFTPRMHKEYATELLEVIPGDGFKAWSEAYAKSQPMVAPTFAKMDTCQEAFFVPCWQVSERFDDFITGGERGMNQDKMPFVGIDTIMQGLDTYLDNEFYCSTGSGPTVPSDTVNEYNEYLTMFQDILESLDICRSVPVIVPDFTLMPENVTIAEWQTICGNNFDVFHTLNYDLLNATLRINLIPFAIQLKVWCEFYRDENLCEDLYAMYWCGEFDDWDQGSANKRDFRKEVGSMSIWFEHNFQNEPLEIFLPFLHAFFGLKSRAWKKDYFTSALPFVQKGPDVLLPIDATVQFYGNQGTGQAVSFTRVPPDNTVPGLLYAGGQPIIGRVDAAQVGTSIQDVRTAFKLEEMYEADGRFGSRYPENTLGQFGVRTPDSRLPRCQFLGRSSQPVQIQQVVQNSQTDETPQGNLAGLANSYGSNKLFKSYQSQHGFIVCFTCIRVHALYQQGIHPMFSRFDRTEYAWPRFAHLGEEPIYTKQLYVDAGVTEDEVFGYTPRYASYKSDTGSIHGQLKNSLNFWTMARRFGNKPVLNEEFIYSRPRQDAFVVTNHLQPVFVMELDYHIRANRLLPFYGIPHL